MDVGFYPKGKDSLGVRPCIALKYNNITIADGRIEGKAESRKEGKKDEKIAIAKKLLELNVEQEKIIAATNLTKEEIEKLKNK